MALNFYLTVPIKGAPVLEPTYLAVDALNLVTGGQFNNPIGTALNPVLESAGNLGYTDVDRQLVDGEYQYVRTFDDTGTPTAFFSFPDVDWEKVPGDLFNLLGYGLKEAVDQGIEGDASPNAIAEVLKLLGLDNSSSSSSSSLGLSSIGGLTDGLVGNALGSTLGSQSENLRTTSFAPDPVSSTTTGGGPTVQLTPGSGSPTPPPATGAADVTNTPRKQPVAEILERLGDSGGDTQDDSGHGDQHRRPDGTEGRRQAGERRGEEDRRLGERRLEEGRERRAERRKRHCKEDERRREAEGEQDRRRRSRSGNVVLGLNLTAELGR